MALDGLVVHAVVHELQKLVGGRISKIYQPADSDIVLQLRSAAGNARLLLSANPTYPRVHLTENSFINPTEPPMFCMLMRKHCEGGVIEAVEQVGMERIIRIRVRQRDELGDVSSKVIVTEIMGRHSNIILLDPRTETILDGIHHVTPAISSYRVVMPGSAYVAPPEQGKDNPLAAKRDAFIEKMIAADPERGVFALADAVMNGYSGISPLIAKEIVYRGSHLNEKDEAPGTPADSSALWEKVWQAFQQLFADAAANRCTPVIKQDEKSGKLAFSVTELTHLHGDDERFDSPSLCLERFFGEKAERDTVKQRTSDLQRFLQNELNKNKKKLEKLEETLEAAKDGDRYRILGELLTASLHQIKKGDKQVEVVNYYDENQNTVIIELDPQLSPSENSQRYFKKYNKMKNSLTAVNGQLDATHEEILYLEALLQQLSAASLSDIEEIREELAEQGYLRIRRKKEGKKKKKDHPALTCYSSSEGVSIFVGKNNLQNEYLTMKLAQSGDTWLHTKDIPGSHVVIRSQSFSEETLHEAAQLAAYFSQARESSSVPVDYTLIRYVRKPAGAKPGFVIYDRQKTLYATPDEKLIRELKSHLQK
ncbi:Rqc2 family fibronectin-binding protein [Gorillibacterium massiliense]|uniref:Rqc2 family fibronectin-binding protein n=1 Tax=Gorillibacterium massiliense TaxID=1280390 RepID=UPI0005951A35|nr:NFACT RNA binding domain-containing protein [Gorillibacterium massiliense]